MPNGFDPVWMETVRIEIDRDRLRHLREGRKGSTDNGGAENHASDNDATDFSIIVWNCGGQGRGQSRQARVGAVISLPALVAFSSLACARETNTSSVGTVSNVVYASQVSERRSGRSRFVRMMAVGSGRFPV